MSNRFDDGGKRIQHYKTVGAANKTEAEKALRQFFRQIGDGVRAKSGAQTLRAYLERWLDEQTSLAPATFRRYRADIERFILPSLGAVKLSDLSARQLNKAYADWQKERRDGRNGPLSPQTVLHAHRVLHRAIADWIREEGGMRPNPCDYVRKPRADQRERNVFTREQARALLEAAKGTPLEVPVALGLGCGLRRNEILALRWRDVDLAGRLLIVAQSLDYDRAASESQRFAFKVPKSRKPRTVAVPAIVADSLLRHRVQQARERFHELVVAQKDGSPLHPDRFTAAFRRLLKTASLPDSGPHAMRHTYATLALADGQNPLAISKALGHHEPGFTLRVYGHLAPGAATTVAEALNRMLSASPDGAGSIGSPVANRLP